MVGKISKLPNIKELTKNFVGAKYELGMVDCFAMVESYLENCGLKVPTSYNKIKREEYPEIYKKNPKKASWLMEKLMDYLLKERAIHKALPGDVLFLSASGPFKFLGVELGNAKVLTASSELGVTIIGKHYYKVHKVWYV